MPRRKADDPEILCREAVQVIRRCVRGDLPGSVGEQRTRLRAAIYTLDRYWGTPTQQITVAHGRTAGTVVIGSDGKDLGTIPLPAEALN